MPVTRRNLLGSMAKLGGAVAETLAIWDFLKPAPALAASFALPAGSGRGRTVAILGAGVSGLCAAYELDLSPKGTLTGAYMRGKSAVAFNKMSIADRLNAAREQGERLHPGYAKRVEHGVAIGWENMEFARGGWVNEDDEHFGTNSKILTEPQGRFHMAGDQLTFVSGWQEGAVIAAHHAVNGSDRQARTP